MAYQIIWTDRALKDLESACEYIERESFAYAAILASDVYLGVARLAEFPGIGREVPEFHDPEFRELIIGSYRVVYRVFSDTIALIRVCHCSRLLRL
ncbi:MAG: type II toxin-antitoxin system RelE/ParE family toxin [Candidatus Riflebacteria bacterium]|nr:type II toxin-antitoxin system RelE/ParE family toxin [Candidatus Riflebacteria bacterium]